MNDHATEIKKGERFAFGGNWEKFLNHLDDNRILLAEKSLTKVAGREGLSGKRFLDIGSGSGLFSLAARRLGASVHSFDYDPKSVACTAELKRRYFPDDPEWIVEEGSVLDKDYLAQLRTFNIVYSWGVLHHTGALYQALENIIVWFRPILSRCAAGLCFRQSVSYGP
ncbi:MAG: class I SAM-dependent methyltransferase [Azoarcus sp.]|nr:class I SAM-dependent methyltransferase [Azoarcus sp.]